MTVRTPSVLAAPATLATLTIGLLTSVTARIHASVGILHRISDALMTAG